MLLQLGRSAMGICSRIALLLGALCGRHLFPRYWRLTRGGNIHFFLHFNRLVVKFGSLRGSLCRLVSLANATHYSTRLSDVRRFIVLLLLDWCSDDRFLAGAVAVGHFDGSPLRPTSQRCADPRLGLIGKIGIRQMFVLVFIVILVVILPRFPLRLPGILPEKKTRYRAISPLQLDRNPYQE